MARQEIPCHRIGHADPYRAADRRILGQGRVLGGVDGRHDVARMLQEARALGREGNPGRKALEQRHADAVLQLLDGGRDGGLRNVQLDRRLADLAGVRRCDEIANLLEGERHRIFRYRVAVFLI